MVSNVPFSPLQLRGPLASDAPGVFGLSSFWSHFGLSWLPATWQPVSDSLSGLVLSSRYWTESTSAKGLDCVRSILICCILCLASTHFLQGCPLPWNKWLPRCLSHWAKKAFQPGVSIQGSWLVSQGHWVRRTYQIWNAPDTPPWPIPSPAVVLMLASFENDHFETDQPWR